MLFRGPLLWLLLLAALASLGLQRSEAAVGGQSIWTNRYNGPGNNTDIAAAVAVDSSGKVFVTGHSDGGAGWSMDYATVAYSSTGVPLWTNRYSGPANSDDYARASAVDRDGNVFVTGYSIGVGTSNDYATVAYSNAGVPLWTNRYNGPGDWHDYANRIAVDDIGNVFVTGRSGGRGSSNDFATIAYSNTGVPLWTNRYNGPGNDDDGAYAIAVDRRGHVFVTGVSVSQGTGSDYATVAYSGAGTPLWTNRYNGPGNSSDEANAIAVDTNGNVFVTGFSTGSGGNRDFATIAYSGAGVPLWTNRYNGRYNGNDYGARIVVARNGHVIVTGSTTDYLGFTDYLTIAYSNDGVPLWTNSYSGPGLFDDSPHALAVDNFGNLFVTGESYDSTNIFDYATVAYSGGGVPLWTNRYNGPANFYDYAYAVAVDADGDVIVTGYSYGIGSGWDFATIKYAATRPSAPVLVGPTWVGQGSFQFSFTNLSGYSFTALAATNVASAASNWTVLGPVPEIAPGQFQFTDFAATNFPQRVYRVCSP